MINYELREAPSASWLLVTAPGLHDGLAPPETWREFVFDELPCHRLYLGHAPDVLLDPYTGEDLRGRATMLISRIAAGLGVPRERIICHGHSFAGSAALVLGSELGAGRIFAGAPCIWLGSWAYRLGARSPEGAHMALFDYTFNVSGISQRESRLRELDRMIQRGLRRATGTRVELFVSRTDSFFRESLWLTNEMALGRSGCTVEISEGSYPEHDDVQFRYYPFLLDRLTALMGPSSGRGSSGDELGNVLADV